MRESGFRQDTAKVPLLVMIALAMTSLASSGIAATPPTAPVVRIAEDGRPLLAIFAAVDAARSSKGTIDQLAIDDLRAVLKRMMGADFEMRIGPLPIKGGAGIYVGRAADLASFPGIPKALEGERPDRRAGRGR